MAVAPPTGEASRVVRDHGCVGAKPLGREGGLEDPATADVQRRVVVHHQPAIEIELLWVGAEHVLFDEVAVASDQHLAYVARIAEQDDFLLSEHEARDVAFLAGETTQEPDGVAPECAQRWLRAQARIMSKPASLRRYDAAATASSRGRRRETIWLTPSPPIVTP